VIQRCRFHHRLADLLRTSLGPLLLLVLSACVPPSVDDVPNLLSNLLFRRPDAAGQSDTGGNEAQKWLEAGIGAERVGMWKASGFDWNGASAWAKAGIVDPYEAASWRSVASSGRIANDQTAIAQSALSFKAAALTPDAVRPIVAMGILFSDTKEILLAHSFESHGFSAERSVFLAAHGISFDESSKYLLDREQYRKRRSTVMAQCRSIDPYPPLLFNSPYSNVGYCYELPVTVINQWLGPTTALAAGYLLLVEFPSIPEGMGLRPALVMKEGAYEYTNGLGTLRTVPRVRVLMWRMKSLEGDVPP
jgi:hypothetical protein